MIVAMMLAGMALPTQDAPVPAGRRDGPFAATTTGKPKQVKPGRHVDMPQGPLDSVVIRLERSACYGPCPDYAIEIHGSGEVVFIGKRHILTPGRHTFRVDPRAVAALVEQFRAADFWSLRPEYEAPITDNPSYTLSLTIGGKTRRVLDYVGTMVGMPAVVTQLEDAVDKAAGSDRWIAGDETTLAALRVEHWDPRSPDAARMLAVAAATAPDALVHGLLDDGVSPVVERQATEDWFESGASALENAAMRARLAIVRRLIAAGAPVDDRAFRGAIASGNPEIVAEFLKYKPDINARDANGLTPLLWVEAGPHPYWNDKGQGDATGVIRLLLEAGADINAADKDGETPLHKTVVAENARAYLAAGASIDKRDSDGTTALDNTFSEDVALLLLDAGAKPDNLDAFLKRARYREWAKVLARMAGG